MKQFYGWFVWHNKLDMWPGASLGSGTGPSAVPTGSQSADCWSQPQTCGHLTFNLPMQVETRIIVIIPGPPHWQLWCNLDLIPYPKIMPPSMYVWHGSRCNCWNQGLDPMPHLNESLSARGLNLSSVLWLQKKAARLNMTMIQEINSTVNLT